MTIGLVTPLPPLMDALSRAPTSAMPESDLFRGYSPPAISRSCLCGRRIEAHDEPAAIAEAVLLHNSSTHHAEWAYATGWR